jgi:hypothetical protein
MAQYGILGGYLVMAGFALFILVLLLGMSLERSRVFLESKRHPEMAGHAYVNQIADPAAQKALLDALGQITRLVARVAALEAAALLNSGPLNANNQQLQSLADGSADTDAVTVRQLKQAVTQQVEGFGV